MSASSILNNGLRTTRSLARNNARLAASRPSNPASAAISPITSYRQQPFSSSGGPTLQADKSTTHSPSKGDQADQAKSNRETKNGAQPKFNTEPAAGNSAEVEKHNQEMEDRKSSYAKGGERESEANETVEKGYWSGQGKGAPEKEKGP